MLLLPVWDNFPKKHSIPKRSQEKGQSENNWYRKPINTPSTNCFSKYLHKFLMARGETISLKLLKSLAKGITVSQVNVVRLLLTSTCLPFDNLLLYFLRLKGITYSTIIKKKLGKHTLNCNIIRAVGNIIRVVVTSTKFMLELSGFLLYIFIFRTLSFGYVVKLIKGFT